MHPWKAAAALLMLCSSVHALELAATAGLDETASQSELFLSAAGQQSLSSLSPIHLEHQSTRNVIHNANKRHLHVAVRRHIGCVDRALDCDFRWSSKTVNADNDLPPTPSTGPKLSTLSSPSTSAGSSQRNETMPTGSTSKRGMCFNDPALLNPFAPYISWSYDWTYTGREVGYVPMLWGLRFIEGFQAALSSFPATVLSFNEPDHPEQSDMSPEVAAAHHQQVFASWSGQTAIGSPAITNGDQSEPPMGLAWLEMWFEACGSGCPVDFVAYHWYGLSQDIQKFRDHTEAVIALAARYGVHRVWLTEFGSNGDEASKVSFMADVVAFLESTPAVERYSAFMAANGELLQEGSLNAEGQAYVT